MIKLQNQHNNTKDSKIKGKGMVKTKKKVVFMLSKVIVREVQQVTQKEEQSENEEISKEALKFEHLNKVKTKKNLEI